MFRICPRCPSAGNMYTAPLATELHLCSLGMNGGKTLHIDKKIRSDIVGKAFA